MFCSWQLILLDHAGPQVLDFTEPNRVTALLDKTSASLRSRFRVTAMGYDFRRRRSHVRPNNRALLPANIFEGSGVEATSGAALPRTWSAA